jgi:branched-chain amino acid transport system permease protein
MDVTFNLLINAIVAGILLGGFYAAVSIGISISFGMLDIVNIAHPAFIILGSYIAYTINLHLGIDPIVVTLVLSPAFFALGMAMYRWYYVAFERRGRESLSGLAFFFGILFIGEVALLLVFGVDYRTVNAPYIGPSIGFGDINLSLRLFVPFLVSVAMVIGIQLYLTRSFTGRCILAVSQNQTALQLMGANPQRIKAFAFGLSIATAAVAGAFLIIIQPVEPSMGREYIGRVFAVCVLGGMGSIPGTLLAAIILGVAESFTATFYGPSWAPAVSFGILLLTLAVRPSGLLGR